MHQHYTRQSHEINGLPRRVQIDRDTPAEAAIRKAIDAVEGAGAHTMLTDVVVMLDAARSKLADYLETEAPLD